MDEEDDHFLSASDRKSSSELAWAIPGNIGTQSFLYGPSTARSVQKSQRANILQYGPHARKRFIFIQDGPSVQSTVISRVLQVLE